MRSKRCRTPADSECCVLWGREKSDGSYSGGVPGARSDRPG